MTLLIAWLLLDQANADTWAYVGTCLLWAVHYALHIK